MQIVVDDAFVVQPSDELAERNRQALAKARLSPAVECGQRDVGDHADRFRPVQAACD